MGQVNRHKKLALKLQQAFHRQGYSKRKARDIVFHLLDWLNELDALHRLFLRGGRLTQNDIGETILAFLLHAPHHINAAAFLCDLGGPEDVFELGFKAKKMR